MSSSSSRVNRQFNQDQLKILELAFSFSQEWNDEVFEKLEKSTRRSRSSLQYWLTTRITKQETEKKQKKEEKEEDIEKKSLKKEEEPVATRSALKRNLDLTDNESSEDEVSQNESSEDEVSQNEVSQNEASQNEASQNEASQNEASQNKASENKNPRFRATSTLDTTVLSKNSPSKKQKIPSTVTSIGAKVVLPLPPSVLPSTSTATQGLPATTELLAPSTVRIHSPKSTGDLPPQTFAKTHALSGKTTLQPGDIAIPVSGPKLILIDYSPTVRNNLSSSRQKQLRHLVLAIDPEQEDLMKDLMNLVRPFLVYDSQ